MRINMFHFILSFKKYTCKVLKLQRKFKYFPRYYLNIYAKEGETAPPKNVSGG